ncbi:hypothetical protein psyc5s11_13130 [Clostridium gelidum]|uniref:VWFA domain-containing protein n=1 Tax=Clostridium gelidum TaxID=704125 RepID=A0ABN6ISR0_9CLOT|nr:VWA domain-containing protein [Clostridium gelidum]BCZ45246.1 hypothetical protein psyc5s11_13130 [Clostridium gelidum]
MSKIKDKKIVLKRVSLLICLILLFTLMNIPIFTVKADDVASKPQFTVSIDSYIPTDPKIGEDITIRGTITPQPFKIPVPAKEIVLVLDTSGSMDDKVTTMCTNERIGYQIQGHYEGESYADRVWITSHWSNDYCKEHAKEGDHQSTKINELKKAAKNFVNTMKTETNLKIGIVTFSGDSTNKEALIPSSQSDALNTVIENLDADGGTNTGEGLRRATYLLSSSPNSTANKTIVFMSDGIPTYYNWQQTSEAGWTWGNYNGKYYKYYSRDYSGNYKFVANYGLDYNHMPYGYYKDGPYEGNYEGYKYQEAQYNYYTEINKESFSDDDHVSRMGTGYSDEDGKCLKYATTIGEEIKTKGYNVFSIGYGLDDSGNPKMKQIHDSMSGVDSNFFKTDAGAIDSVFKTIAAKIKDNYPITNIDFNFNPDSGTTIDVVGGNRIRLNDIIYKKDSESNGIIIYKAAPVPFTITIKSKIAGDNIPVFTKSTITFPWNTETISVNVPATKINVRDNELPYIEAAPSAIHYPCKSGEDVTITYNITPHDFIYSDMSSQMIPKDVVIVLDTSSGMSDGDKIGTFKNAAWNDLLNNSIFTTKPMKYGLVTYNSDAVVSQDLTDNKTQFNDNVIKNIQLSTSVDRNIGSAIDKANGILQKDTSDAKKYLILLSSGDVTYTQNQMNSIKDKGYKVLSMALGKTNDVTIDPSPKLKELTMNLGGTNEDYFISVQEGNNNATQNYVMKNLASRISDDVYKTYNFNDVKLKFDLNGNFDAVNNLDGTNDKRSVTVPNIEYTNNNGVWHANSTTVSFRIKPNKIGSLSFKENIDINNLANTISYKGINKNINRLIATPIIDVTSPIQVIHGVYKSVTKTGTLELEDTTGKTFANGTIIPMAASFEFYNNPTIKLTLDANISIDGDVKIYKINLDGSLNPVATISKNNSSYYEKSIVDGFQNGDKVLVLYNDKLPKLSDEKRRDHYTNSIKVGDSEPTSATVRTTDGSLPDLF